jgi:hypothetical protein
MILTTDTGVVYVDLSPIMTREVKITLRSRQLIILKILLEYTEISISLLCTVY